jgi:uncharacterized protein (TIRG00374 family)
MAAWLGWMLWAALTIALVIAARGLPWRQAAEQLSRLTATWLGLAVLANFAILPLWALEWRILVPGPTRVGFSRMFEVIAVTAAVLNSVPFFAGEVSGVALLISRTGLARGAALSVLALDQLLVAFAKITLLGLAAAVVAVPLWLRGGVASLVAGFLVLIVLLVPLAHRWEALAERIRQRSTPLRALLARVVDLGTHLETLRDRDRIWRVATLALAKKLAELLAIIAVQMAFGLDPSFAGALLVLAALAVMTLLPIAPANLGVYEATVFAAYRFLGVPAETALGLALVQHLCFLLPSVVPGYLLITVRQLLPRRLSAS